MKVELDGDTIRLDGAPIAFIRGNASINDRSRLKEVLERSDNVSPNGAARKRLKELRDKLEEIIDDLGEIT